MLLGSTFSVNECEGGRAEKSGVQAGDNVVPAKISWISGLLAAVSPARCAKTETMGSSVMSR